MVSGSLRATSAPEALRVHGKWEAQKVTMAGLGDRSLRPWKAAWGSRLRLEVILPGPGAQR